MYIYTTPHKDIFLQINNMAFIVWNILTATRWINWPSRVTISCVVLPQKVWTYWRRIAKNVASDGERKLHSALTWQLIHLRKVLQVSFALISNGHFSKRVKLMPFMNWNEWLSLLLVGKWCTYIFIYMVQSSQCLQIQICEMKLKS